MSSKLYVGNLPYSATEQDLQSVFSEVGAVESVKLITDRDTGRSKGFAFVQMASTEEAGQAINKLNGAEFGGRALNVSEARPMAPRDNSGGGRGDYGGGGRGDFGGGRGGRGNRF